MALLLPALQPYAWLLLAAGVVVHAAGMTLKHRIESRQSALTRWELILYWLCWAILAMMTAWIVWRLAA